LIAPGDPNCKPTRLFLALIFNNKSRDSDSTTFQRLSTMIGRFFAASIVQRVVRPA